MTFEDKQTGKIYDDKFTVMQGLHDKLIKTEEENKTNSETNKEL